MVVAKASNRISYHSEGEDVDRNQQKAEWRGGCIAAYSREGERGPARGGNSTAVRGCKVCGTD